MAAFPLTLDNYLKSFKTRTVKPSNRQTSSAGYTMSFSRATTSKKAFDFTIGWLTNTERETLETFFDTNQGTSFTIDFTCTGDTTTYTVVFDMDELSFDYIKTFPAEYDLTLSLKEV
jgi:hypothetical protein